MLHSIILMATKIENNTLTKIYKVKNKKVIPTNLSQLEIDNKKIRFFQDILFQACDFKTDKTK